MDIEIGKDFTASDYARGYVCAAPNRKCSPHITVTSGGVWIQEDGYTQWSAAHRSCVA